MNARPWTAIQSSIVHSEKLYEVSNSAYLFYLLLLTQVDAFGRIQASPVWLLTRIFPGRPGETPGTTRGYLGELQGASLIELYEVDGRQYLRIPDWEEKAGAAATRVKDRPKPQCPPPGASEWDPKAELAAWRASMEHPGDSPGSPRGNPGDPPGTPRNLCRAETQTHTSTTNPPPNPPPGGSSADAEGGAVGVDPPDPEPGHDEPRGPRHVVASAPPLPPWAHEPLEEVRMRSPQRRAQTVEWAQQWCEPARVLRAVVGEVRKLKATEPAGLLAHAIESGKADGWLEALDRGASPQSKPLARRAVPWDQELEAIVLGFAGHDRGYELVDAEELANQRYGGREAARRKFAEAVVHVLDVAQAADSVPSILPVGDYAETARRLLGGDSEVACG